MEFERVVRRRRMCRRYTDQDISDEQLEAILDLAARFPSAGHTQPQELVVIRDRGVKQDLAHAALDQMFLAEAPVVVAVVSDTARSAETYGRRGVEFYSIVDGAFASMLVLLAAVDRGLGAAFVAAFDDDAVGEVLALPDHVRPIGLIAIGHPADRPRKLRRRDRTEIVHRDRYGVRS
jgi:nitroreductase